MADKELKIIYKFKPSKIGGFHNALEYLKRHFEANREIILEQAKRNEEKEK